MKWIKCDGEPATQTSVSHEISSRYLTIVDRSKKAVTNTRPAFGTFEQFFQFPHSLRIHWAVTCDRLNQHKPILFLVIYDDIRHLPMFFDFETQGFQ